MSCYAVPDKIVDNARVEYKVVAGSLTPKNIPSAVVSMASAFWLDSMENIFELEAVLDMDSLISFFLPAKTLLGLKVIG